MRRVVVLALVVVALALGAVAVGRGWGMRFVHRRAPATSHVPRDTALRRPWLWFYPSSGGQRATALVVFFGNDVGFWEPHQELAERLADAGYAVAGVDIVGWLAGLPDAHPARETAFAADAPRLLARLRRELAADSLPIVLGGHSFGAELALWVAAHEPPPGLAGVLAMSPRGSGHFVVTPADLANEEPQGVGAFSTIETVRAMPAGVRVAVVRGSKDQFARHDAELARAGGERLAVYGVPLAAHSLRKLLIAGPIVERAVRWLLAPRDGATPTRGEARP